jgi:hypothetical protein
MKRVRPRPLAQTIHKALLTPEEDFVLKRIQGELSVDDLSTLTGIEPDRIDQIVQRLASRGAIAVDAEAPAKKHVLPPAEEGTASLDDFAAALGIQAGAKPPPRPPRPPEPPPMPTPPPAIEKGDTFEEGETSLADFASALGMDPVKFGGKSEPPPEPPTEPQLESPVEEERESPTSEVRAAQDTTDELIEMPDETPLDILPPEGDAEPEPEATQQDEETAAAAERNYRQLYMTKYAPMTADQRLANAKVVSGSDLMALCYDPESRIVAAIMENHNTGLDHVRMLAQHHRTGVGLERISRRQDFVRDLLVERRLLRNPMIGDVVLDRVMNPKRILPTYKIAIDRDIPELTRVKTRGQLRKKWQGSATSEERADIVLRTEARCLALLTGCTFDSKTTQILCARPYASAAFVHNLCKFGAAPPSLLAHLFKQPFVRKNPMLKKLLLQHPNMPSDVKRQV